MSDCDDENAHGEDIGEETHDADQTTFFVAGDGHAVMDEKKTKISQNHLLVIPKGSKRNIINAVEDTMQLFTVYAPPAEDPGISHKTKADAEAAEKDE